MILKNKWLLLNLVILSGILAHSVRRDIFLNEQYPSDLRNRIVGARLQKDGKLPYFFHAKSSDFPRYTDPVANPDPAVVSNITASPFFHDLLMPVCDLPQKTLSTLWLVFEYLMLFAMIGMVSLFAKSLLQKMALLNTGILFTITEPWIRHVASGQLYLFVALLICITLCFLLSGKKSHWILAGAIAATLVLVRPAAFVICIPFLFHFRKYFIFLVSSSVALCLYGLLVLIQPFQKSLWLQYRSAIEKHIEIHQGEDKHGLFLTTGNYIPYLEGYSREYIFKSAKEHPIVVHFGETGSFFAVYKSVFHQRLPLKWLNAISLFNVCLFSLLFFLYGLKRSPATIQVFMTGFLIYMLVEIFNPVTRYQYNVVQWLPLLLVSALCLSNLREPLRHPASICLLIGFILTITRPAWIPDRNILGELAWFFAVLLISFNFKKTLRFESPGITK